MNQKTKDRIGSLVTQMVYDVNFLDRFADPTENQLKRTLASIGEKSEELSAIIQQWLKFGDE